MISKVDLRRNARLLRSTLFAQNPDAGVQLAANFMSGPLRAWHGINKPIIAGYWPFGSEIDARPLLTQLADQGCQIALPVSGAKGSPLVFRQWQPGMALQPDAMGMPAPPPDAPALAPDIMIIPALAFDRAGHRLGSGAGYYDITLEALRAERIVVAVAAAFAGQEVETIFPEAHDQAVDWVVTEADATYAK